jgi:hypothetical protein
MKIQAHEFQLSVPSKFELDFTIGHTQFQLRGITGGYIVRSNHDALTVTYTKGMANLKIEADKELSTILYDFSKYPDVVLSVSHSGKKARFSGNVLDVIREVQEKKPRFAIPRSIALLLNQKATSAQFRSLYLSTIRVLIPYEDYFPYFQNARSAVSERMNIGGGGVGVADPQCNYW